MCTNLLLAWTILFAASHVLPVEGGRKLGRFVEHFEPLSYAPINLQRSHGRVKRSLSGDNYVYLRFRAHNREFHLKLEQDSSDFHKDLVVETAQRGFIEPDISHIYTGSVIGDPGSHVYGALIDGVFEGGIKTRRGHYYVEQAAKYFDHGTPFHSVVYSAADVRFPTSGHGNPHRRSWCGVTGETERWMNHVMQAQGPRRQQGDLWRRKSNPWLGRHLQSAADEPEPDEAVHSPDDHEVPKANATRRSAKVSRRVCNLQINIDHTLYGKHYEAEKDHDKTHARLMKLISLHVNRASYVYRRTNFDGVQDISFAVQHVRINDSTNCQRNKRKTNPFCSAAIDSAYMLHLASKDNHDDFCLSYFWTFRDFSDGLLGLAWIAKPDNGAGGICEKNRPSVDIAPGTKNYRQFYLSLNTGILTFVNYNMPLPLMVSEVTFMHEIGHNFGSQHDTDPSCAPGGDAGNYIMFPSATSGTKPNNQLFSACSRNSISAILVPLFKGTSSRENCFQEDSGPICGNTLVEANETCDCGYLESECQDKCCYARKNSAGQRGCTLKASAKCSPTAGPCCDRDCNPLDNKTMCSPEGFCTEQGFCDGLGAACPVPPLKPNMTECNQKTQVCLSGQCTGSVCLKYDMKECTLTGSGFSVDELCLVACEKNDGTGGCQPIGEFEQTKSLCNLRLQPGSPCNGLKGYCDVFHKCRDIDEEGPLTRLQRIFFGSQSIGAIRDLITKHPIVAGIILIVFLSFLVLLFRCFAVHTPTSNPHKKQAHKLRDTMKHPINIFK